MKTPCLFVLFFLFALVLPAWSQEKPVQVTWDPPSDAEAQLVSGYNVYRATITPALLPANYDVNLTTPLAAEYVVAYQKLNADLIPKDTREFTITNATPGLQIVVRAWSSTWGSESPDSDVLTLRPMPGKVQGLKTVALILESSTDLKNWVQRAIYELAFVAPSEAYRLRW